MTERKAIRVDPGDSINIYDNFENVVFTEDEGDLVIQFSDGSELWLLDFVAASEAEGKEVSLVFSNGIVVHGDDLLAHLRDFKQIDTEADPLPEGGGGSEYKDPTDEVIITGIDPTPPFKGDYDLSDLIDYEPAVPYFPKPSEFIPPVDQPISRVSEPALPDLIVYDDPPPLPENISWFTASTITYGWDAARDRFYILSADREAISGATFTISGGATCSAILDSDGRYYFDFSGRTDGPEPHRETYSFTVHTESGESYSETHNLIIIAGHHTNGVLGLEGDGYRIDAEISGGTGSTSQFILINGYLRVHTDGQKDGGWEGRKPDVVFLTNDGNGWVMPTIGSHIAGNSVNDPNISFNAYLTDVRTEVTFAENPGDVTTVHFFDPITGDEVGQITMTYVTDIATSYQDGDIVIGNSGDNHLNAYGGLGFYYGMAGKDGLVGGHGTQWFDGGDGDNDYRRFKYEANEDQSVLLDMNVVDPEGWVKVEIRERGELTQTDYIKSVEKIEGGSGPDFIIGDDKNNVIHGRDGADLIKGRGGDDRLYGGDNIDILQGQEGDDHLFGGKGDDFLFGGKGADRLTGGWGADTFYFGKNETGTDTITDYNRDEGDIIQLKQAIDNVDDLLLTLDGNKTNLYADLNQDGDFTDPGEHIATISYYDGIDTALDLIIGASYHTIDVT